MLSPTISIGWVSRCDTLIEGTQCDEISRRIYWTDTAGTDASRRARETRPPDAVDASLGQQAGTVMMVINSIGGCAAGRARPGIALSLDHLTLPDRVAMIFADGGLEANARVRGLSALLAMVALFKDGQPVYMFQRDQIENRQATGITKVLIESFGQFCGKSPSEASS